MLSGALENHDDFVLAWERPGDETGPAPCPVVHVITGNLITPCRLKGITGRALLYEEEGAAILTGEWKEGTPAAARSPGAPDKHAPEKSRGAGRKSRSAHPAGVTPPG